MLIYQRENYDQVCAEAQPLTQAHWDEAEAPMHGAQHYTLDRSRYKLLEDLGMLHIVAARDVPATAAEARGPAGFAAVAVSGALVGYAAFALCPCPHRESLTLAALDGLYLAPRWRKGFTALELLRHAETQLAARGVGIVQYSSPASRPCDVLYKRLGASHTETLWHKEL